MKIVFDQNKQKEIKTALEKDFIRVFLYPKDLVVCTLARSTAEFAFNTLQDFNFSLFSLTVTIRIMIICATVKCNNNISIH